MAGEGGKGRNRDGNRDGNSDRMIKDELYVRIPGAWAFLVRDGLCARRIAKGLQSLLHMHVRRGHSRCSGFRVGV